MPQVSADHGQGEFGVLVFLPVEGRAVACTTATKSSETARVVADLLARKCVSCEVRAALELLVEALAQELEDAAPSDLGYGFDEEWAA